MTDESGSKPGGGGVEKQGSASARDEQLRTAVHALNNVLAVIQLNAAMASESLASEKPLENELNEILAAVVRGKKLLEGLSAVNAPSPAVTPEQGPGRRTGSRDLSREDPALDPGGGERILFIDDEPELARLGQRLLVKKGYQVSIFTDSQAALEEFAADPHGFDLVVTDQNMPGLNGIELASRILTIRPEIPILVCTGYSNGISRWNFSDHGFCELLVKPYQPAELLSAVRTALAHGAE